MLAPASRLAACTGVGFEVTFELDDPRGTLTGRADPGVEVDLACALILDLVQAGVLDDTRVNYVNSAR